MNADKVDRMDPLSIAESLGIKTFRKAPRNLWSPDDDARLINYLKEISLVPLAEINPDNINWEIVALKIQPDGSRKSKDVKKRWITSLDPNVKKGKWTREEDDQLIEAYNKFGPSWQRVASYIRTRTMDQCAKRYTEVLDPKTKDRLIPWTQEEELLLIKQIGIHGTKWRTIAAHFKNRPALTCRNKWRAIALAVARGRAHPHITAEVERITTKNDALAASTGQKQSPTPNQTEWKYTLGGSSRTDLPHKSFLSNDTGTIDSETTVNQLLGYARHYGLSIEVHQHVHNHYAPPPHPFNHVQSPPVDYANVFPGLGSNGSPAPAQQPGSTRLYFLEPEAQLNRFQHFNYLPPLTEVPKLTSSNSPGANKDKNYKREESLTPLTQAVEIAAAEELSKKRKKEDTKKQRAESDDEEEGLDFWEQMRNLTGLQNQHLTQANKPVSQHHPLHHATPQATPAPTIKEEEESYMFYKDYRKSNDNESNDTEPQYVYDSLLGFGGMPFNPS